MSLALPEALSLKNMSARYEKTCRPARYVAVNLISSSSFHRLDMTLAVAEALNPNKPNHHFTALI